MKTGKFSDYCFQFNSLKKSKFIEYLALLLIARHTSLLVFEKAKRSIFVSHEGNVKIEV